MTVDCEATEDTGLPFPDRKIIYRDRQRCNYRPINCRETALLKADIPSLRKFIMWQVG
ncbi:MAG: hypothetical protein WBL95_02195 [Microcoleus sp.]